HPACAAEAASARRRPGPLPIEGRGSRAPAGRGIRSAPLRGRSIGCSFGSVVRHCCSISSLNMPSAFNIDAKTLALCEDLDLLARTIVEGFFDGLHRSPFLGYSTEFSAYRQYTQGD